MATKNSAQKKAPVITNHDDDGLGELTGMSIEAPKKVGKKDEKKTIQVLDKEVSKAISTYVQAKKDKDAADSKLTEAEGIIKPHGLKLITNDITSGLKVDSFILGTVNTANPKEAPSIMYGLKDAYEKIATKDRAEELMNKYVPRLVTKTTKIGLNAKTMATRVKDGKVVADIKDKDAKTIGSVLAGLIMGSKDIPADLKSQLLVTVQEYTITKDVVNQLKAIVAETNAKEGISKDEMVTVEELISDINPQQFLKGIGDKA